MDDSPVRLETTKPDTEVAKELRELIIAESKPLLAVMDKAREAGFHPVIQFAMDQLGRWTGVTVGLQKHY